MTNKEILEKAIQKAIDGGWELPHEDYDWKVGQNDMTRFTSIDDETQDPGVWYMPLEQLIYNHEFAKALWDEQKDAKFLEHYVPARGYPGESIDNKERNESVEPLKEKHGELPEYLWYCTRCKKPWKSTFNSRCEMISEYRAGWRHHLQQMVISDDPIKYLGEHI